MKRTRLVAKLGVGALVGLFLVSASVADNLDYNDFDVIYCLITGVCSVQLGGQNCQAGCMVCRSVLWHSYCELAHNQWGKCTCTTSLIGSSLHCTLSGGACEGIVVTP